MKRGFTIMFIILTLPSLTQAGDTCKCSTGNQYMGVLPCFNKYIFGLRYNYSSLHSHMGMAGSPGYAATLEKYNTAEFWAGWNIARKIRIMGAVPYRFETLSSQAAARSKSGLGDIYILGYYRLLDNTHATNAGKQLAQNLWFGTGVELPTGKYDSTDKNKLNESANLFQLGSASTDVIFDVLYGLCLQHTGLNISSMYKINTVNKYGYEYGNRFNVNAQAYYKFNFKQSTTTIAPVAGILFENYQHAVDNDHWVKTGEGDLMMGTIGIETSFKTIVAGGNFQIPLLQTIGNGAIKANNKYMLHVSFNL